MITKSRVDFDEAAIKKYIAKLNNKIDYQINCEVLQKYYKDKYKKSFIIDSLNFDFINFMIQYFNSKTLQKKGILLNGGVGTGKSTIFSIFSALTQIYEKTNKFRYIIANDITDKYAAYGENYFLELIELTNNENILIDDLGIEEPAVMNYGNKVDIMSKFLERRYNIWQVTGLNTHITSNLKRKDTNNEFLERYGTRINDRLNDMTTHLKLIGNSRRG